VAEQTLLKSHVLAQLHQHQHSPSTFLAFLKNPSQWTLARTRGGFRLQLLTLEKRHWTAFTKIHTTTFCFQEFCETHNHHNRQNGDRRAPQPNRLTTTDSRILRPPPRTPRRNLQTLPPRHPTHERHPARLHGHTIISPPTHLQASPPRSSTTLPPRPQSRITPRVRLHETPRQRC
jgi:hypothetical protein